MIQIDRDTQSLVIAGFAVLHPCGHFCHYILGPCCHCLHRITSIDRMLCALCDPHLARSSV